MVLRNHEGQYISGKTARFQGSSSVLEAEVVAIYESLKWVEDLCVTEVAIESDSLLGVTAVNKDFLNYMELGTLVQQCKDLLRNRGDISVKFIRKQANKVAHELAKISCVSNSYVVISSPPSYLLETILSDALIIE